MLISIKFFVRGVVYQPQKNNLQPGEVNDPIADDRIHELERNVSLLTELGINTIFIYFIDNQKPHDRAMKLLEQAGIYVVATVSTPFNCIHRANPYASYNPDKVSHFLRTAGIMSCYPNTLGLAAANALVNNHQSLRATPVIKAVIRDLKRYMIWSNKYNGTRILPVSYSAADVLNITRPQGFLEYLYLGDQASAVDFWMCKNYSWAGESSMAMSGWDSFLSRYEKFAIPALLSEYGTNLIRPRQFHETRALYSDPMTRVFSGGCLYDFAEGPNGYGLVALPGTDETGWFGKSDIVETHGAETRDTDAGKLYILYDFGNYKAALAEPTSHNSSWSTMELEAVERHNVDTSLMSWPWGSELQMPETCIDWDNIEGLIGAGMPSPLETITQRLESTSILERTSGQAEHGSTCRTDD
ncbi:hypothetical protein D6D06_08782 [Aureobasidium pullulans]|nr:hypothetical protein D6D06_08782 [Aureobasidium pullulans]